MADIVKTTEALSKIIKSEEGNVYNNFLDQLKQEANWTTKVADRIKYNLRIAKEAGVVTDLESSALATLGAAASKSGETTMVAMQNFSYKLRLLSEAIAPLKTLEVKAQSHYNMDFMTAIQQNNMELARMSPEKMKIAVEKISTQLSDRYSNCTDDEVFYRIGACLHNRSVKF